MNAWIEQIFYAGQVNKGNVVRRAIKDVAKLATISELESEVKARGFHMVQINDQFVIICNKHGEVKILV